MTTRTQSTALLLAMASLTFACKTTNHGEGGSGLRGDEAVAQQPSQQQGSGNPDFVRLYVYPSTWGFDWSTPSKLTGWLAANFTTYKFLAPHNIGHADVEVFCKGVNHGGQETHFYAGQSGGFEMGDAVKAGEGLGVLTYSYQGKLYTPQEVKDGVEAAARSSEMFDPRHDLGFITVKINPQTCERLATYFKEYSERRYYIHYGSRNRPRYGEGAGCTAFGVSFLELAGVLEPEMQSYWTTHIRIPSRWVGAPGKVGKNNMDDYQGNGGTMPIRELVNIVKPSSRWAAPNEPGVDINLYDPDKIYDWILQRVQYAKKNPRAAQWTIFDNGNFKGIDIDRTAVPTPAEPIWLGKAAEGLSYAQ